MPTRPGNAHGYLDFALSWVPCPRMRVPKERIDAYGTVVLALLMSMWVTQQVGRLTRYGQVPMNFQLEVLPFFSRELAFQK